MARVRPFLIGLYGGAGVLFLAGVALRRIRRRARAGGAARAAHDEVTRLLERAASAPAGEIAGPLGAALRDLARAAGRPAGADPLRIELDEHGYDPARASVPLPAALRDRARAAAASWRGPPSTGAGAGAGAALAVLAAVGVAGVARADVPSDDPPRAAYQAALAVTDPAERARAFAHAEELYRADVAGCPDCPELLTDWGNAALGAGDLARATLAYRRALALRPGLARAQTNLAWVRAQQPPGIAPPADDGAVDALLFWHRRLSAAAKHAWGAACVAIALLLLTPTGARGGRRRRRAAIVPALIALAMFGSLAFEPDRAADAVVVADEIVLRAADSSGAPAAVAEPTPAGAEVTVLEHRAGWERVRLGGGAVGWLPSAAIERVER
jgi:hypothetical protein